MQASVSGVLLAMGFRYMVGSMPVSSDMEDHGNWFTMDSGSVWRFLVIFASARDAKRRIVKSIAPFAVSWTVSIEKNKNFRSPCRAVWSINYYSVWRYYIRMRI